MSTERFLSGEDVQLLLRDPSAVNRAQAASKVGAQFSTGSLTEGEREIAEDIFRAMVRDVEVRVRKALADTLKDSPDVPHDVALTLATDVAEVALPIIENSIVLADEDLVEIIENNSKEIRQAVARREIVSETVTEALVDTSDVDVVAELVKNEGARLTEAVMHKVLDDFATDEKVNEPLTFRHTLPMTVAERLVTHVSERLKDHLVTHHELSDDVAADLLISCRERATVGLLSEDSNTFEVKALIEQLHEGNRLTPTIIMRALFVGDTTFFEAALAKLADVHVANAYQLIHDKGNLGLEQIFKACHMPLGMLPLARAALNVAVEMSITGGDDRETFKRLMIERVLTTCEESVDPENFDYLIAKLGATSKAA